MSDDKPKAPLPLEDEWEKALDAWEPIEESPPRGDDAPRAPDPPARGTGRGMPAARGPLYHPPSASMPTPIPPAMDDAALASLHAYDEQEDDERTIVSRISPEMLAGIVESRGSGGTGSGLGQVFRRNVPRPPPPPPSPKTSADDTDALIDSLFEDPAAVRPRDDDASVVTSAREILPNESGIPDAERKRDPEPRTDDVPEGAFFDPFGPSPNESSATVRPAAYDVVTPAEPAASASTAPVAPQSAAELERPTLSPASAHVDTWQPPPSSDAAEPESGSQAPAALSGASPLADAERSPSEPPRELLESVSPSSDAPFALESVSPSSHAPPASSEPTPAKFSAPPGASVAPAARTPSPPEAAEPPVAQPFDDRTVAAKVRRTDEPAIARPDEHASEPSRGPLDTMPDERAALVLEHPEQREAWWARAAWLEEETRADDDRNARARGLLMASELFALVDEPARSHELASEARELAPNHPLAHRQARALAMREGDWTALTDALQAEGRAATTPSAKAHDAFLSAEIARLALADADLAAKRLEQAMRADPADPRAYLSRMASALGAGEALPRLRVPEGDHLGPIAQAFAALQRWHGSAHARDGDGGPLTGIDWLLRARAALRRRDSAATVAALDALGEHLGLAQASGWLAVAIAMTEPSLAHEVTPRLEHLARGSLAALAQRAIVSLALAAGDAPRALATLHGSGNALTVGERVAVQLLAGTDRSELDPLLEQLASGADGSTLARAVRAALDRGEVVLESEANASSLTSRLARRLAAGAPPAELVPLVHALTARGLDTALGEVLSSELELELGHFEALATSLSSAEREAPRDRRDRAIVAALLFELTGSRERAGELYAAALTAEPSCEAATRAMIALSPATEHAKLLVDLHEHVDDARSSALLLIEAAHVALAQGDEGGHRDLLHRAHERAPGLPLASWLSERRVRAQGNFDEIVWWLRERRNASHDPVERAYDLTREALLVADRDLDSARDLLQRASDARPRDLSLRDLYERMSPVAPADKASYWAERALEGAGESRARLALLAAYEYEIGGDAEQAARLAQVSLSALDTPLARICLERNEAESSLAANLADRLLRDARASEDPRARLEAYERLAQLDELSRGDVASAMLWHRSILEERPGFLPSLSRLFHWLTVEGRDEELEPIAAELARALHGPEAAAHAHLAARLRTRAGPWVAGAEHVRVAFAQPQPPLWAVRDMDAHAVLANDASAERLAASQLLLRTNRPLEVTTIALRAADAAERSGDAPAALELLRAACRATPTHLVAARSFAELAERHGNEALAAAQWETVAGLSRVPAHRLDALYRAATCWLDRARDAPDVTRGRAALEAAAAMDITHRDVFTRLRDIYGAESDRPALAALLEARLAKVDSTEERIELEIARGRTLAEIGDSREAKRALSFALDASPDHPGALRVYADVCAAEADWSGAEQALIRLSRLVAEPAAQAAIYAQLGDLYAVHQPNPERAELAYREVLKRMPADVAARERLIALYCQTGRATDALEVAEELVRGAATTEARRRRTIELALLYEQAAGDRKRGEALLESARKESPNDIDLLSTLAEMYARGDRSSAVQALLDRAAGDARRALSTGRFDVGLFATLAAVARLRGRGPAARIAEATVAAMEGRPGGLAGASARAAEPNLDDQLAPELMTRGFRSILRRAGHLLDLAAPLDLAALRAVPLARSAPLNDELAELAGAMGIGDVEVFVSPALGGVCIPASSQPARIVLGAPLMATDAPESVRRFLATRAFKIVQARASALARSAPIDLLPLVSAYLLLFAPNWQPSAVDASKLADMHTRLLRAGPIAHDPEAADLALEVIASLGNRTSTLHTIVNGWGNRVALLACGDMSIAFAAIARSAGHAAGPAPRGPERITWIGRNAEARDLALFSVSDAYADVRTKLGLLD